MFDVDPAPAYYHRRERQERDLARAAIDPAIRNIHLDLAQRYAALARTSATPRLQLVSA